MTEERDRDAESLSGDGVRRTGAQQNVSRGMLTAVMEDYVKAIYAIGNDSEGRVSTSALADSLSVTAPTVSSMVKKLEKRGLIDHEEYKGVTLTEEGELVALEIVRHHRLLEAFLTDELDYDWADVHDEADRLEHHVSAELTDRIAEVLDDPPLDPHGDPIPDDDLAFPDAGETSRLVDATESDQLIVRRVHHQDEAALRYLADAGVRPGAEIVVLERAPFGMVTVKTPAGEQGLPEEIANRIEVLPEAAAEGIEM